MKKLIRVSILVLLASLVLAVPVFAYAEVTGLILDGYGDPWEHGGVVTIYNEDTSPRTVLATCAIESDGSIGDGSGGACLYTSPGAGFEIRVYIDPDPSTNPPYGNPGPQSSFFLDDGAEEGAMDIGYVYTNTGPNAVSFSSISGFSTLALALVLPLAVLGGVVYTKRKRQ